MIIRRFNIKLGLSIARLRYVIKSYNTGLIIQERSNE